MQGTQTHTQTEGMELSSLPASPKTRIRPAVGSALAKRQRAKSFPSRDVD